MSRRNAYLLRVYGITEEQYNELLSRQNGGCGVCGKTPEQEGKALAVDHDHKTGMVRGILCFYCNHFLIGRHRDPELLERMARYLKTGTGWFVPPKKKKRRRRAKNSRSRH